MMNALTESLAGIATSSPEVMHGTLVFTGSRVPVANLLGHLAAGGTLASFLCDFPGVSCDQAEGVLNRLGSLISPELFDLVPA